MFRDILVINTEELHQILTCSTHTRFSIHNNVGNLNKISLQDKESRELKAKGI